MRAILFIVQEPRMEAAMLILVPAQARPLIGVVIRVFPVTLGQGSCASPALAHLAWERDVRRRPRAHHAPEKDPAGKTDNQNGCDNPDEALLNLLDYDGDLRWIAARRR
jgi:hypothetical protein